MDEKERAELEQVMAGIAEGDPAMPVRLYLRFGRYVRATMKRIAGEEGIPMAKLAGDLDELVWEGCLELVEVAGSWRPDGGALPWVWARRRLAALLHRWVGPPTRPLAETDDLEAVDPAPAPPDEPAGEVLARLAATAPEAAVVAEALELCLRPDDRDLLLDHVQQVAEGDPSPAVTLAPRYRRSPAAIRKQVQRNKARLARLADRHPRFAVLHQTALLDRRRAA